METNLTYIDVTNLPEVILEANSGISNAIANDGLDDAGAIQAAIDWLTAQRETGFTDESTIFIPGGIFDLAGTIKVNTSDIKLEGAGTGLTVLQNADTFQIGLEGLPDSGVNVNSVNRDAYLFDLDRNGDDVTFTNMTISGPEVHGAIFGYRTDNLTISEVEFNNFLWSSVRLFNVDGAIISDNVFVDAGGRAEGNSGETGGSIYATYLSNSEIYNNDISWSGEQEGNVYGIKGRQFRNTHIHHNTINTNFAIELPFENDHFVEISHNFLGGVVSIPKFAGGSVPADGFTFHLHHNYFTRSYSLEWARNGAEIDHNVFVFDTEEDGGNLISNHGTEPAPGPTEFYNNLILNPGRGIFWSRGVYDNFSFYNNEIIANETVTPRSEGLFDFNSETDFSTIEIRDNIIEIKGISRPLVRNEASYGAVIENNTLSNVSDVDKFDNPDTGSLRGLIDPLLFQVGVNGEFTVDGAQLRDGATIATLSLALNSTSISENGGTATATVTRNTDTSEDLDVTLSSSDTTEATVPATVVIPAGQTSASFRVTGVDDAIADGTQTSTITVSALGFESAETTANILDDENRNVNRVTEDLLALYTFDAGEGNIVYDISGVGDPLDLTIAEPNNVVWGDGTLKIETSTVISSTGAATKFFDPITGSSELTIEAWVTTFDSTQNGPARIATFSQNNKKRNFTLAQNGESLNVRLRTTETNSNGTKKGSLSSPDGYFEAGSPTHVVYTRDVSGQASLFINDELVSSKTISGDFSNWDEDYTFALANEVTGAREWLGTFDLVAIYSQAFNADEVNQNFQAGSDFTV